MIQDQGKVQWGVKSRSMEIFLQKGWGWWFIILGVEVLTWEYFSWKGGIIYGSNMESFSFKYRKLLGSKLWIIFPSGFDSLKGGFMILIDFFFKGPTESAPREKNRGTSEKGLSWCVSKLLCWRLRYNSAKWPKSTLCVTF